MSRRLALVAGLLCLSGSVLAVAPTADAAVVVGKCRTTGSATITPGLTLTAKVVTTTFTGKLTGCTGTGAPAASATFSGSMTSVGAGQTCLDGTAKGTMKVTWANGKVNTITVTQKPNTATASVYDQIVTGVVTSGPGTAEKATSRSLITSTPTAGDCFFSPVSAVTTAGTIAIRVP